MGSDSGPKAPLRKRPTPFLSAVHRSFYLQCARFPNGSIVDFKKRSPTRGLAVGLPWQQSTPDACRQRETVHPWTCAGPPAARYAKP
jgi:hypothetical protein